MKIARIVVVNAFVIIFAISCGSRSQNQREQTMTEEEPFEQIVPEGWQALFDGNSLDNWEVTQYDDRKPFVKNGVMTIPMSINVLMTSVCWNGEPLPENNYAIYYEARRVEGNDIFGAISFPYGDTSATLIVGGWGGLVCGISCIAGYDASENETTKYINFKDGQWYPIYLRVTTDSIRATIDNVPVFDLATAGKRIHLRGGMYAPALTLSTYLTTGEIRNLRIKKLP